MRLLCFCVMVFLPMVCFVRQLMFRNGIKPYRPLRAGCCAGAAANALGGVWGGDGVNVHFAGVGALTALDTGVFVHFQMIDADFVEQPIDGAQRAERLTEKAEDKTHAAMVTSRMPILTQIRDLSSREAQGAWQSSQCRQTVCRTDRCIDRRLAFPCPCNLWRQWAARSQTRPECHI